jgi:hypothetical protein
MCLARVTTGRWLLENYRPVTRGVINEGQPPFWKYQKLPLSICRVAYSSTSNQMTMVLLYEMKHCMNQEFREILDIISTPY